MSNETPVIIEAYFEKHTPRQESCYGRRETAAIVELEMAGLRMRKMASIKTELQGVLIKFRQAFQPDI